MALLLSFGSFLAQATGSTPIGGSGSWLVWGLVLLALAVAFFVIEVFLPTGALMGVLSAASAVAGVVCFFQINTTFGALSAAVVLASTPVLVVLAFKIWPDTPIGQWLTLHDEQPRLTGPDAEAAAQSAAEAAAQSAADSETGRHAAIHPGDVGQTLTPLRPVGVCILNGRRCECFARSGSLDADVEIEVVSIRGKDVYVRERTRPSS